MRGSQRRAQNEGEMVCPLRIERRVIPTYCMMILCIILILHIGYHIYISYIIYIIQYTVNCSY
jgi:hypothetical protein